MIVPQLASGGWTPIDRNESAASVRIVVAIISGNSTITVVSTFGRISLKISRRLRRALRDRRLDVLLLAHGQHLAAHRPEDVRHVDDAR